LDKIFNGDQELIAYLQRVLGYTLTGLITGQCWFLLYGLGANGKTTLMRVIQFIFGDYARQTQAETFLRRKGEVIRNDLARLQGARLISTSEPPSSGKLDESLLKAFIGEDLVSARYLHKEFVDYAPVGKIFVASNHLLKVEDSDHGFWRKVRLIPFDVTISVEDQDQNLRLKLEHEASGILTWMVEGFREWQIHGVGTPQLAQEAVEDYRAEMDVLADFLANPALQFGEDMRVSKAGLYDFYSNFHGGEGRVGTLTRDVFNRALTARGYKNRQVGKERVRSWVGIGLRNDVVKQPTS
jgi:putative DNA primase/helicase